MSLVHDDVLLGSCHALALQCPFFAVSASDHQLSDVLASLTTAVSVTPDMGRSHATEMLASFSEFPGKPGRCRLSSGHDNTYRPSDMYIAHLLFLCKLHKVALCDCRWHWFRKSLTCIIHNLCSLTCQRHRLQACLCMHVLPDHSAQVCGHL